MTIGAENSGCILPNATRLGIYGIFSYHVRQQIGALAVRMALGAQANDVMRLLGRELLFILTIGCLAGLLAAWGLTRWISSLLFGLSPTDPWTLSAATALLIVTAILAGYFPARRAARTNPAHALHLE